MNKITKNNLESFLNNYLDLHDGFITNINYDITKSQIELLINIQWSRNPKNINKYITKKRKMKIYFNRIEKCNNKELFSWDFIFKAYIKFIVIDNKEFICFANDETNPNIYIVCDTIEYEVLN